MQILRAVFATSMLILVACQTRTLSHPHEIPIFPTDIEARLTLKGPILRYSARNKSNDKYIVIEDMLTVQEDGMLIYDSVSFGHGQYRGPSVGGSHRFVLLAPGESLEVQADLRKSYHNLDLKRETLPPNTPTARAGAFDSRETAEKYQESRSLRTTGNKAFSAKIPVPWHRE